MLLLASRLGLRASDIVNLKFSNIDWDHNEILLTLYKTGNPIKLPLLSDVGNAIIDYLQYGRLKSNSQHIFLAHKSPYNSANSSIVCGAIRKIINHSGVAIESRHHGPHSLRHSLASNLLNNETSILVITGVLGHQHTDSTMTYLRINIKSLMRCALPVPPVNDDFYTQKGDVFYE